MPLSRRRLLTFISVCAMGVAVSGVSGQNPNNPAGLDVSYWQGTINWTSVKNAGISFVFIRAGHGPGVAGSVDTKFATNWPAAKSVGILRGAYWYVTPQSSPSLAADAQAVANLFVKTVMPKQGDLQLVLDFENNDAGLSKADMYTWMQACVAQVQLQTHRPPIIYCSPGLWSSYMPTTATNMGCPLWVAHWGAVTPTIPAPWKNTGYAFWQYSSTGSVAGLNPVDQDTFNGSATAMLNYTYPREPLQRK